MGIFDALMGKTNFRAQAPVINTKAGQAAIRQNAQAGGQAANALGYSLAASGRGAGSGLALREAQRRGAAAITDANAQASTAGLQLEQAAMQQNANNQMQAQQINAQIAQSNAGGLQKLVGAGAQGFAMGMTGGISDERAKQDVTMLGSGQGSLHSDLMRSGQYQSATAAPVDDGRRVQWIQADPRATAETEHNAAVARERGVDTSAPMQRPGGWSSALGAFGDALSDERSKTRIQELESTIRGLTARMGPGAKAGAVAAIGAGAGGLLPAMAAVPILSRRPGAPGPDHVAPAPLGQHEQVVSAPTEAEALQIARAREAENQRQLDADLGARTEEMARIANERQQLAAMPGSGGRTAETARAVSDAGAKYVSDKNAKITNYLAPVRPVSYEYKPDILQRGEGDPGQQYGLLAQDLARTPQGASVVERGPDGLLRVQIPQLAMMNTAADAEQQREIDRLKKKVG